MPSHGGPGAILAVSPLKELSSETLERKQTVKPYLACHQSAMLPAPPALRCLRLGGNCLVGGAVFEVELDILQT